MQKVDKSMRKREFKIKNIKSILTVSAAIITLLILLCSCHDHIWEDATCETPKTCSECGEQEGEPTGHQWVEAACEKPKTCSVCDATDGEPSGHEWTSEITKEATVFEEGINTYTCSICGDTYTETIEKIKSN